MPRSPNGHKGLTRAAIYVRTSTERQSERVSPDAQLADCTSYAQAHGYTVTAVYTDTERYRARGRLVEPSGTRSDRPQFTQLVADGQAGLFDVIIAWREDRLYRGIKPAVIVDDLLESTPVRVELAKETFDRKMLFLKASIARIELDGIAERTQMGMRGRVQRGLHYGGRIPAGYRAVKDVFGRTVNYALKDDWRPFFDQLARLFLARIPYAMLGARLPPNPATGRGWEPATLRRILTNPFYKGLAAYNWRAGDAPDFTVPGLHPAAWDADTIAAIDRELARRHHNHWGPRGVGPWSGVLRCGLCGGLMASGNTRPIPLKSGRVTMYRNYFCTRPRRVAGGQWPGPTHAPNSINERKLMRLIRAGFASLTAEDVDEYLSAITLPDTDAAEVPARLAMAQAECSRLENKLADLAVGLEGVRHASPAATDAILSEIRRAGQALDTHRATLAELSQRASVLPDLDAARAAMLRLIDNPALFDHAPDELTGDIRAAFPALFVAGGQIVAPVEEWPRPAWKPPQKLRQDPST